MGNFETREFTCADCLWGSQCPAEFTCEEFDLAEDQDHSEAPSRDDFEKEYLDYCANRQGPREKVINVMARPLSLVAGDYMEV